MWSESKYSTIRDRYSISTSYIGVGIYIKCTGEEDVIAECELFDMTYCSAITTVTCSNSCTHGDFQLNSLYTSSGKD